MEIFIRKAVKEDIDAICRFQQNMAMETENISLDSITLRKGVNEVFSDPSKGTYWIADINNKSVASMLITPEWSDWRNKTVYWFQSVYVEKEYRKNGVFRMMYYKMKSEVLADENIGGLRLYVDKSNQTAQKVYENLGMNGDHYRFYEWMKDF